MKVPRYGCLMFLKSWLHGLILAFDYFMDSRRGTSMRGGSFKDMGENDPDQT